MLLNLGLNKIAPSLPANLRKAPNIVTAPQSNIDVNAVLGLTPSKYSGLQSVGDTGYYYGNNRMYETYTPSSGGGKGSYSPYGLGGGVGTSVSPFAGMGGNSGGGGGSSQETLKVGDQNFRTIDADIAGFNKTKVGDTDVYEYAPSQAYLSSLKPAYMPTEQIGYNPVMNLLTPKAGGQGAGRFLADGGLMALNFAAPKGE